MTWFKRAQEDKEWEWSFPEADHDYDPSWEYEIDESPAEELASYCDSVMDEINSRLIPEIGMGKAKIAYLADLHSEHGGIAVYINGTAPYPVFGLDLRAITEACQEIVDEYGGDHCREVQIGIRSSLIHELGHAIQDWMGMDLDEDEAETFARDYCDFGEMNKFWE